MTTGYRKPLPRYYAPTVERPFYEAAKRHELVVQRCLDCGRWVWYARELCPYCMSQNLEWTPVSGKGRVYSFTIVYQPASMGFADDIPIVNINVLLDEGVRMYSKLVDHSPVPEQLTEHNVPEDIRCDMPVEVVFEDVTPEWTLVHFKRVREN